MIQFALPLPWWTLVLLAAAVAFVAWASYSGALAPLSPGRRTLLVVLRAATLLLLVACLLRPVRVMPPDATSDAVVPILVDVSRSMRLADAGGQPRIAAARALVEQQISPALAGRFPVEAWTFGDRLVRGGASDAADGARSDLSGALRELRERYRERRVAGVVVISDGGDTGAADAAAEAGDAGLPIHTIGVGAPDVSADFEVLDLSAGAAAMADSSVELSVSAVARGSAAPFDLRVLENGSPIDVRRVEPAAAGSPVRAVFTVAPSRETATLYTIEIPSASGELALENNRRSVLVEPPGRRRRVLMVEGAPGFEHSFVKRALTADPGLEIDSVVRKGRDARGDATYFVQAASDRAPLLASGFPADRASLFHYDALVLANVEPDSLSGVQLESIAGFVGERGAGLLVLGARSFAQRGLVGTPVEAVLPVALTGRDGAVARAANRDGQFGVSLTGEGAAHPVMRIAASAAESTKRWRAVPSLAAAATLGGVRPGAQVLAQVATPEGSRPLVAVQRYGRGRSMVFAGEASWRWRMQMPAADRTFELFWRQSTRWLAAAAPAPVQLADPGPLNPGDAASIGVDVRDQAFTPLSGADVLLRITAPGGEMQEVRPSLADAGTGRYTGEARFERPGVYRVSAEAKRGGQALGSAERWILVGAADGEMADPRLNEEVLRRVSRASGGSYLRPREISSLSGLLAAAGATAAPPRIQELWDTPWMFALIVALLTGEWMLRRRWGLR